MIYIITGVSGCGKTTIGSLLAKRLDIEYYDADNYHPESNIRKMASGTALTDEDRGPWLKAIHDDMVRWHRMGADVVLGCSALKREYRLALAKDIQDVQWIQLSGPLDVIATRIESRSDHFFDDSLLKDQLDTIEFQPQGWHFDITSPPDVIVDRILARIEKDRLKSDIGIVGMGVMGRNLALNCAENGLNVAAFNRHVNGVEEDVARKFISSNPEFNNITPFDVIPEFISNLKEPRVVLLMVRAGQAVDDVINHLGSFLQAGDILIDGGNSHFKDTERRAAELGSVGVHYVGMGISGGEEGARHGPSMMPGVKTTPLILSEILDLIAAKDRLGNPCWTAVGHGGAGHFVKMIHNGIEYAEMQLIAECYQILSMQGTELNEIADTFEEWQDGELNSFLLEATTRILRTKLGDHPALGAIADIASHKGTGKWSIEAALDLGAPSNSIFAALFGRQASSKKLVRSDTSRRYPSPKPINDIDTQDLREAYLAARIVNHIIGFEIIRDASTDYSWAIELAEIARIWTNGCIIRSALMESFQGHLQHLETKHLLVHPWIIDKLSSHIGSLRKVVGKALTEGKSIPCLQACVSYFNAMTEEHSAANLIAAQRDYFGAHGFTPSREGGPTHLNWTKR